MRITRIAGLALTGAAAVAAVGLAGVAYANAGDPADSEPTVRIVTEHNDGAFGTMTDGSTTDGASTDRASADQRDCPEKSGEAQPAQAGL